MSYPQGYLYQAPGSLALYSCPAYGASALAAPRSEELARSASGSAFSPYPGSAAFTAQAATGFGSPLQYSADAAAAAAGFPSYMVTARAGGDAGHAGVGTLVGAQSSGPGDPRTGGAGNVPWAVAPASPTRAATPLAGQKSRVSGDAAGSRGSRVRLRPASRAAFLRLLSKEPGKCDYAGIGICCDLSLVQAPKLGEGSAVGSGLASLGARSEGRCH